MLSGSPNIIIRQICLQVCNWFNHILTGGGNCKSGVNVFLKKGIDLNQQLMYVISRNLHVIWELHTKIAISYETPIYYSSSLLKEWSSLG